MPDIEEIDDSDIECDNESDNDIMMKKTKKTKKIEEDDDDFIGDELEEGEDEEEEEDEEENEGEESSVIAEPIDTNFDMGNTNQIIHDDFDDDDDDDEMDENYLQKFSENIDKNIITDFHPELKSHNYEEIETLCKVVRDTNGFIIDPLHKTLPFITKYEKTRIIGERAKQLNAGAKPFIVVDNTMIDGYLIALKEYEEKKIPFIIRRPIPNGTCEYWKLKDLEMID